MTQAENSRARAGKHKALRLILGGVLCLAALAGLGSLLLDRFGVGVHGNPFRLVGLAEASLKPGCYPEHIPMACQIAGRAWRLQSSGAAWGLTADNDHPGQYRFELHEGDMWAKDVRLKKGKGPHGQVERVEFSDLKRQPFGKDFWFGFTLNVEPGPKTTSDWVNLGQLHNTPDPGEASASPPWVQGFGPNDSFRIFVRHTAQNPLVDNPAPIVLFEDHNFQRGRPYRFVYRFRWDPKGNGLAQVWRDDVLVGNYKGPFGYPDQRGGYFKFGIYRRPAPETMVVHYA
ncbi:MAG: hypothetical protein EON56_04300, partial [Alphaproteobacteria bacterium]